MIILKDKNLKILIIVRILTDLLFKLSASESTAKPCWELGASRFDLIGMGPWKAGDVKGGMTNWSAAAV